MIYSYKERGKMQRKLQILLVILFIFYPFIVSAEIRNVKYYWYINGIGTENVSLEKGDEIELQNINIKEYKKDDLFLEDTIYIERKSNEIKMLPKEEKPGVMIPWICHYIFETNDVIKETGRGYYEKVFLYCESKELDLSIEMEESCESGFRSKLKNFNLKSSKPIAVAFPKIQCVIR